MTARTLILLAGTAVTLTACELGPKLVQQTGYRGQGLEQVTDPDNVRQAAVVPAPPFPLSPTAGAGPRIQGQNIQVLGDLSEEQFTHAMSSFSQWLTGDATNCGFCHNTANMADDSNYRLRVARQMIRMTRALNSQWSNHTGQTGVTCYTCHRGNAVPQYVWTDPAPGGRAMHARSGGQNRPDPNVGYASLPYAVFGEYFAGNPQAVRVASDSAYPEGNRLTTRDAETSYGIMMHVSQSLGVNCTYCHNSQSFRAWSLSSAQRATAWYGIRMVRDINQTHIMPLAAQGLFPANRLGPAGDPYRVNCLTCHQGQTRPMGGTRMIADYPYLRPAGVQPASAQQNPVSRALRQPEPMTGQISPPNAPETGNSQAPAR
jgi:photosynthetic reaction center cytochrome c subunit